MKYILDNYKVIGIHFIRISEKDMTLHCHFHIFKL